MFFLELAFSRAVNQKHKQRERYPQRVGDGKDGEGLKKGRENESEWNRGWKNSWNHLKIENWKRKVKSENLPKLATIIIYILV